jgi:hypothetical protein
MTGTTAMMRPGQGADDTVQLRPRSATPGEARSAPAACVLLGDGAAAAALRSPVWSSLCFLPLLFVLVVFAPVPLSIQGLTFADLEAAARQNLPLAWLLVILLAALVAADLYRRLSGDRSGRRSAAIPETLRRPTEMAAAVTGSVMVTGAYALMVSNKALPLTEGWFELFARYVNAGKVPYRDFDLLAPPLYTYILAGITRVFGYDLIVLRLTGVVVFVAIAVVACLLFSRLFTPFVSMVAACVTALFMQSEVANIFYDYIRFFDLLAYGATLALLVHVLAPRRGRGRVSWALVAAGLCSSGAALIRQSSGAILIAAILVVLLAQLLPSRKRVRKIVDLAVYVAALLAPVAAMVALMAASDSLRPFLDMTSGNAIAAKGGMLVVLFGWLGRVGPQMALVRGSIGLLLGLLIVSAALFQLTPRRRPTRRLDLVWTAVFAATALGGVLLCLRFATVSAKFVPLRFLTSPYSAYPVAAVVCAYALVQLARGRSLTPSQRRFHAGLAVLTLMALALGYGAATSGGLSEGETALALGAVVACILALAGGRLGTPARLITLAVCITLCLSYVSFKIDAPYAWWSLREPSMRDATETTGVPRLRGIRVSPVTKAAVDGIVGAIDAVSGPGDEIFVFPHMPLFYLLTDRYPGTFTLVQWFDFSSKDALVADVARLKADPPKVMVIAEVPDSVYTAHEQLFLGGKASTQRWMRDQLEALVHKPPYREVGAGALADGYRISVYAR